MQTAEIFESLGDIVCHLADTIIRPPERLEVSDAAEKYRYLNNTGSYIGWWDNDTVPYMVEPMNVLGSREYNSCIFVGPSQSAKTDIILNWHLYGVACDPADLIIYQMSQSAARDFSIRRIKKMHRDSPKMKEMIARASDSNVFDTTYKNGVLLSLSWPSINEMSSKPIPHVALTDYDRFPLSVDGEGSPFSLAHARTTTFGSFAMTFAESSPGHPVTDPKAVLRTKHSAPPCEGILSLYNSGDRRRWYWPCPHCEEYFEPHWKLLTWNTKTRDSAEAGESAAMMCPHCFQTTGALIEPRHKMEMNLAGRWIKDGLQISKGGIITGYAPFNPQASFWLKGPAAAFLTWQKLVKAYVDAQREYEDTGSFETLKSVLNTKCCEPFIEPQLEETRTWDQIKTNNSVDLPQKIVPSHVRGLLAHVDTQKNRWEVQIHGLAVDGSVTVVDRFPIVKSLRSDDDGDRLWVKPATYLEDWDLLETEVMDREYPLEDESGHMAVKMTFVDMGGYAKDANETVTENAYKFWLAQKNKGNAGRIYLIKGSNNLMSPRAELRTPDTKVKGMLAYNEIPVIFFNVNVLKDSLNGILDRKQGEGGTRVVFPTWLPDQVFKELCAEVKENGVWKKQVRANETWDLLTYCLGTLAFLKFERINWDNPPLWLAPWPVNALVRKKNAPKDDLHKPKRLHYGPSELANILG